MNTPGVTSTYPARRQITQLRNLLAQHGGRKMRVREKYNTTNTYDERVIIFLITNNYCYLSNKQTSILNLNQIPPTNEKLIADTGSTCNYVSEDTLYKNKHITINSIVVTINGITITSAYTCKYPRR